MFASFFKNLILIIILFAIFGPIWGIAIWLLAPVIIALLVSPFYISLILIGFIVMVFGHSEAMGFVTLIGGIMCFTGFFMPVSVE